MTYRSMLVSQSHLPGAAATAVGVQADSNSPIPKLRFEFVLPKVEGTIAGYAFVGINVKVVVELMPKPERESPLVRQPGREVEPVRAPQPAVRWDLEWPAGWWSWARRLSSERSSRISLRRA